MGVRLQYSACSALQLPTAVEKQGGKTPSWVDFKYVHLSSTGDTMRARQIKTANSKPVT